MIIHGFLALLDGNHIPSYLITLSSSLILTHPHLSSLILTFCSTRSPLYNSTQAQARNHIGIKSQILNKTLPVLAIERLKTIEPPILHLLNKISTATMPPKKRKAEVSIISVKIVCKRY